MKDPQNVTIFLLLITAAILGAMLISSYMTLDNTAYATATAMRGDYIMSTGARSGSRELLFVIDRAARRLNVYETNTTTWAVDLQDSVDLRRAFR
jgi:hypothetical protein